MTQNGRRFLKALASQVASGCFLELGPLFGSSTQAIAAGRRLDAPIHTIDTFQTADWIERRLGRQLSREAFEDYTSHIDNLVVHEGFAPDVVRDTWSDQIGFYFNDATHGDPGWTDNFEFFQPFFTEDAVICGNDFAGGWPGVTRNVTRIADDWGVGLYVFGRVWAMTRVDEQRIVDAATEAEPVLAGATITSVRGPDTSTSPAMVWTKGLHQQIPLSTFKVDGDAVARVRFKTTARGRETQYGPGDWVHLGGVTRLSFTGPGHIGFQLCFAKGNKTVNTKLYRAGDVCKFEADAVPVSVRLGMI